MHPLTQPGIAGGNITLTCTAIGFPLTIIQPLNEEIGDIVWLKNNVLVTSELIPLSTIQRVPGNTLDITVFTSLTITDLQLRDVANYSCNASNDLFEPRFDVSNDAELTVLCEHWIDKYRTWSNLLHCQYNYFEHQLRHPLRFFKIYFQILRMLLLGQHHSLSISHSS